MNAQTETKAVAAVTGLDLLRVPFPPNQISKLPKPTPKQTEEVKANPRAGIRCKECGGWHHKDAIHLDYVGHAALTDRLLDCDPEWNWEPMAVGPAGTPLIDGDGGMWIRLTVCGVTRLGYGHADGKKGGNATKEAIGDALRNAAMRFGAALDLWHKGDLHGDDEPVAEPRRQSEPPRDALHDMDDFKAQIDATVFAIGKQPSLDALKAYWATLDKATQQDARVIKAKDERKEALSKPLVDDEVPY